MKVIRKREKTIPPKWVRRCTCGDCTSVLEVEESDLSRYRGIEPCGDVAWDHVVFTCPCCNALNRIDAPTEVVNRRIVKGESPGYPYVDATIIRTRDHTFTLSPGKLHHRSSDEA